jgi:hypothetical protein
MSLIIYPDAVTSIVATANNANSKELNVPDREYFLKVLFKSW